LASLVCVAFVKVPVYPFSLWLPEAHVEGSVFGSIALTAFAMKFSVALLILFGVDIFILFCYVYQTVQQLLLPHSRIAVRRLHACRVFAGLSALQLWIFA
jgi:NADH:ubiquinone oxidoreductase subunit 4 (subunit M)